MFFSISSTISLGSPQNLLDTGMGGSTFMMISLLIVFKVSFTDPHKNWFFPLLSMYLSRVKPSHSFSGSYAST